MCEEKLISFVEDLIKERDLQRSAWGRGKVLCAYDTRESSQEFSGGVEAGVESLGVPFQTLGVLTTPQLHYIVRCTNDPAYGVPTEEGYYDKILSAYRSLNEVSARKHGKNSWQFQKACKQAFLHF